MKKKYVKIFAAVAGAGLLAFGANFVKDRFFPSSEVVYDPNEYVEQKDPSRILTTVDFLRDALKGLPDEGVPSLVVKLAGDVPEFILYAMKDAMEDGHVHRKEFLDSFIKASESLEHDLQPSPVIINECAAVLEGYGVPDPDGATARKLANCAIYISIAHWDLVEDNMVRARIKNVDYDYTDGPDTGVNPSQDSEFRITVIGDSLAEGVATNGGANYVDHLSKYLDERGWTVDIDNRGIAGKTSDYASKAAQKIVNGAAKDMPDIVILELGGNDNVLQRNPEGVKRHLEEAIQILQSKDIEVVLVGMSALPFYDQDYQDEFDRIYSDLAIQYGLLLEPVFMEHLVEDESGKTLREIFNQELMADPMHPNHTGAKVLAKSLLDEIEAAFVRVQASGTSPSFRAPVNNGAVRLK